MRNIVYIMIAFCLGILFCEKVQGQNAVSGTVFDAETMLPVVDASIVAGARGTQTDSAGRFSIIAEPGTRIVISHVSYLAVTHVVKAGENNITISLTEDKKRANQDEVITVGFTKKAKTLSTAATAVVTADDIKDVPVSNLADVLQGKIAGVNIQSNNGMPGARGAIFQRGLSSLNVSGSGDKAYLESSQPLFVIDGVPIDVNTDNEYGFSQAGPQANPLTVIPPEDVESVEVLKDAAATVLYGSRGVNGVWIITTKKGKTEKPEINYSGNFNMSLVPKLREVIGGKIERDTRLDQIINHNRYEDPYYGAQIVNRLFFLSDSLNPYYNNSTDWQSYFYGPKYDQSHNLSFRGGSPALNYKINTGYSNEKGILKNTGYKRYNINMNAQYDKGRLSLLTSVIAASQIWNTGSAIGLLQSGVARSGTASTLLPPPDIYNTEALAAYKQNNDQSSKNIMANVTFSYKILKNLTFRSVGSLDYNSTSSSAFTPSYVSSGGIRLTPLNVANTVFLVTPFDEPKSQYYSYGKVANKYYNRNMFLYNTSFDQEKHAITAYIFNDIDVYLDKASVFTLYGGANDNILGPYGYNLGESEFGILGSPRNERIFGYGGSLSYNYDHKYVLSFDLRRDRSSLNGPMARYSTSPSVGARWNFGKEKFVQDLNFLSSGAVRFSWGRNIVPQGNIFMLYGAYLPSTTYMGRPTVEQNFGTSPNAYFRPKNNTTVNFGLDLVFKKGISLVYEAYYRTIENQYWKVYLPAEQGFDIFGSTDAANANYGHELNLTVPVINKGDFRWITTLNGAYNRDVLTRLPNGLSEEIRYDVSDPQGLDVPLLYRVGKHAFSNMMYISNGVFATNEEVPLDPNTGKRLRIDNYYLQAGDPKYVDVNGDYVIDGRDIVPVGNPMPLVTGGLNNTFSYKSISLTLNGVFTLFRDVINTPLIEKFRAYYSPNTLSSSFPSLSAYNVWEPNNTTGAQYSYPYSERSALLNAYRYNQTAFMEDASYFKLLSATLGYSFTKPWLQKIKAKTFRVFVTGRNLFVLTKYSGPNPETVSDLGRDLKEAYPYPKRISVGINATF